MWSRSYKCQWLLGVKRAMFCVKAISCWWSPVSYSVHFIPKIHVLQVTLLLHWLASRLRGPGQGRDLKVNCHFLLHAHWFPNLGILSTEEILKPKNYVWSISLKYMSFKSPCSFTGCWPPGYVVQGRLDPVTTSLLTTMLFIISVHGHLGESSQGSL